MKGYAERLRAQLEREEGKVLSAYPDPLTRGPPWTIGIGHTGVEVGEHSVWTEEQVEEAYERDILRAERDCMFHLPWFVNLGEARRGVLVDMCFQMGWVRLSGFHDTLAAVRDGHYAHAAECMRNSNWAHQTPRRCVTLAHQMETGEWQ